MYKQTILLSICHSNKLVKRINVTFSFYNKAVKCKCCVLQSDVWSETSCLCSPWPAVLAAARPPSCGLQPMRQNRTWPDITTGKMEQQRIQMKGHKLIFSGRRERNLQWRGWSAMMCYSWWTGHMLWKLVCLQFQLPQGRRQGQGLLAVSPGRRK